MVIITIMNAVIVLSSLAKLLTRTCLLLTVLLPASKSWSQQLPPQVIEQARRESLPAHKREKHDNYQAAAKYWYASRNPRQLEDMEEALKDVLPRASKLSSFIDNFQTWEEAQNFKAYHDAGAVLLAKAYTCLYYGDVKKAAPAIDLIETKFPYAMILAEDRSVTWVRTALRYHEHCCMLYAAMSLKVVGKIHFPRERDEFDGLQQRKAIEHMAVLRLREGNVERLEHFFTAINHSELQTSGGDWALDIIMNAMRPLDQDVQSEASWQEIHDAILIWQKQKPSSVFARLAEARYLYNYVMFKARHRSSFAAIREASERGLKMMPDIPKTSPAWYDTMLRLQAVCGRPADEIAPVFQEGLGKYPDYTPYAIALGRCFVNEGEDGRQICSQIVEELQSSAKGGLAAQMLRRIYLDGSFPAIQPRLNLDTVELCIRAAVARWPDSYELRSDLGILAVTIGRRELAADIMQGMSNKWCRNAWRGREDIAIYLTSPAAPVTPRVDPMRKTTL